jgi:glycerol-3-phosphate dehydrogenase
LTADDAEVAYLLRETNRVIPAAGLRRESVLYAYAGVRPLAYVEEGRESGITRRHFIRDHAPEVEGLLSVVGGKLTTYRNLTEQAVDLVFGKLGRDVPACPTARLPLPGASAVDFKAFAAEFRESSGLGEEAAARLLKIYGTRAAEVLSIAGEAEDLRRPFSPLTGAIGAEVLMAFREELARTLADCLLRRTMVGLDEAAGLDAVEGAAGLAVKYLGWTRERERREIAAYRNYVRRFRPRSMADLG